MMTPSIAATCFVAIDLSKSKWLALPYQYHFTIKDTNVRLFHRDIQTSIIFHL